MSEVYNDWEPIAALYWDGGCYEWDESHVYRKPNGDLVGAHDAGCSCNYFGMDLRESDFMDVRTDRDIDHLADEVYKPLPQDVVEFKRVVREALHG